LLELKLQQEDVMMEIKSLEMDVTNAMLNHYGHVQDHLQYAHSNAEMGDFNLQSEKNVMMVTDEMGMVALLIVNLSQAGLVQLLQDLYQHARQFVEMVR